MYQWERPADMPKPPLRRWSLFVAAKWGAGLAAVIGLVNLISALVLAIRGASSPAAVAYAFSMYLSAVVSWAILFLIVAAIRNRFLPKSVREAGRISRPPTEARRRPMLGFIWPPALNAGTPNAAGRLGRVLHWTAALFTWIFLGIIPFIGPNGGSSSYTAALVLAACTALVGRAARYVLAAE